MSGLTPTENTTYRGKQLLIGRESDMVGNVLAKAIDISAFATAFTATDKPQKKTVEVINNAGQQSPDITGSAKFEGSVDMNMGRGITPMIIAAVVGTPVSFLAKVSPAWATGVVTGVGDIVQHSGGKYLVAQEIKGDATTGALEPVLTTEVDYDNLAIDGTDASNGVIWKLRDTLFDGVDYASGFCTDKMVIIERVQEGCGSANIFDTICRGVELTAFNINKADGTISAEGSIPFVATSIKRSSAIDYVDITVTTEIKPRNDVWKDDDCTIRVDGAKFGSLLNFNIDYTRTVRNEDGAEPFEQITIVGSPVVGGAGKVKLDPAVYNELLNVSTKSVQIVFDSGDGESMTYTAVSTTFDEPDIETTGNEPRYMMFVMKPTGDATTPMVDVDLTTSTDWS